MYWDEIHHKLVGHERGPHGELFRMVAEVDENDHLVKRWSTPAGDFVATGRRHRHPFDGRWVTLQTSENDAFWKKVAGKTNVTKDPKKWAKKSELLDDSNKQVLEISTDGNIMTRKLHVGYAYKVAGF